MAAVVIALLSCALLPVTHAATLACGSVITHDVTLDADIGPCPGDGLVVGASGITIDLRGHTVSGTRRSHVGVRLDNVSHVTLKGGTIEGFSDGVLVVGGVADRLSQLTLRDNRFGLRLRDAPASGHLVEKNTVTANRLVGILLERGVFEATISKNAVNANAGYGIVLDGGSSFNRIESNTAFDNGKPGIELRASAYTFSGRNLGAPGLHLLSPAPASYVEGVHFGVAAGVGDVTGRLVPIDIALDPAATALANLAQADTSTSGCESSDYVAAGFQRGDVALIQRGTCKLDDKIDEALRAGAGAIILFNEGQPEGRTGFDFGTLGSVAGASLEFFRVPALAASYATGFELLSLSRAADVTVRVVANSSTVEAASTPATGHNLVTKNKATSAVDMTFAFIDCGSNQWVKNDFAIFPTCTPGGGAEASAPPRTTTDSTTDLMSVRALLFTDVVDSTKWVERLGDAEAARLWADHDRRARDLLAAHGGREIDRSDGFFLLFETAHAAVAYALAYHEALGTLGLRARAAIHVGAVVLRTTPAADVARGAKPLEVEGIAKPLAARIMALARGGQTLLSAAAHEALCAQPVPGGDIERHGHYRLKGIESPIEIHEVGRRGASPFMPPADGDKAHQVVQIAGHWRPVREVRHNLAPERDAFVGRTAELRALATQLDGGARLLTVVGAGGAGKTRLVRRYAWSWMGDWPGGVYFCDLAEARSFEGVCFAVASALEVPLGRDDHAALLAHAIAGRGRCLVILDNFEQVLAQAPATVGRWLDQPGQAAFVVTSRERLRLAGEALLPLAPLPVATDSVELFCARAAAQRPDFELTPANREAVTEIVRVLDGLPLAIELAAARIAVLTPAQLLARLVDRFALLADRRGSMRQDTLRHAIDWSWSLLAAWEQAALAQCSVFEGGFDLAAAEAVLDLRGVPSAPAVLDVVQALVDKSLLHTWRPADEARYHVDELHFGMYVSIREYAREKLLEGGADAERAAEQRHGRHYGSFGTDAAVEALSQHGGVARRRELALDIDNLVAACRRALARGDAGCAVATYRAAWEILELQGPVTLAAALGHELLALDGLTGQAQLAALMTVALPLHRAGRIDEAAGLLEKALLLAQRLTQPRAQGRIRGQQGTLHMDQGRIEQARHDLDAALNLHRQTDDRRAEGATLGNLGNLCLEQGLMDEARQHYEAALAVNAAIGNRRTEGSVLGNLGLLHFEQGRFAEALEHYERALAIHREVGSRRLEGTVLGNLGLLHSEEGRFDASRASHEAALAIHRAVGNRRDEAIVLANLGELHFACGSVPEALDSYRAALAIAREVGYGRVEGNVLGSLGELLATQGRIDEARESLQAGEAILRKLGDRLGLAKLLCARGSVERSVERIDAARAALAEAEALAAAMQAGTQSELGSEIAKLRLALGADVAHQPVPGA